MSSAWSGVLPGFPARPRGFVCLHRPSPSNGAYLKPGENACQPEDLNDLSGQDPLLKEQTPPRNPQTSAQRTRIDRERAARLAWYAAAALAAAIFVFSLPGYYLDLGKGPADMVASLQQSARYVYIVDVLIAIASIAGVLLCFYLAFLLFRRKPANRMALFVSYYLLAYAVIQLGPLEEYVAYWPGFLKAALVIEGFFWIVPTFLLIWAFPSGRLTPRWMLWLISFPLLVALLVFRYIPPWAPVGPLNPTAVALVAFLGVMLLGALLSVQVYRYRHISNPVERQQTRWVFFGFVLMVAMILLLSVAWVPRQQIPPDQPIPWWAPASEFLWALTMNILPVSLAVAILQYRLWDLGVVVNQALVYGGLTGIILSVYVLVVGGLGAFFQARSSLFLSLLATGLAAILFQPARERLQRAVNRMMYGERDNPYEVLSRLGRRIEASISPETTLPIIVETIAMALKLPYVSIELANDDGFLPAASYGALPRESQPDLCRVPLIYQNEQVGQLVLSPRQPGGKFTPVEERLLADIARQAGPAASAVQLTANLRRSRQRIVAAREEERRRLRRDLHDELGPQLASQALMIEALEKLVHQDPDKTARILRSLKLQSQGAVKEIRQIVYNLRPPALDNLGLAGALREAISSYQHSGVAFHLQAPEQLPPLPAAVEVAAFRIGQEALTNVVRHAQASRCTLHLEYVEGERGAELQLEIVDDGTGVPDGRSPGVGLNSMRERVAELGGDFRLESLPDSGTRISVRLPVIQEAG